MAVDYGMFIGFASNDLIVALLITQFVGFPSALVFGKLGQRCTSLINTTMLLKYLKILKIF